MPGIERVVNLNLYWKALKLSESGKKSTVCAQTICCCIEVFFTNVIGSSGTLPLNNCPTSNDTQKGVHSLSMFSKVYNTSNEYKIRANSNFTLLVTIEHF